MWPVCSARPEAPDRTNIFACLITSSVCPACHHIASLVLAFINTVSGMNTSIFVKISLKSSFFIPSLAQRSRFQLVLKEITFGQLVFSENTLFSPPKRGYWFGAV
jgi:hypothetical protein